MHIKKKNITLHFKFKLLVHNIMISSQKKIKYLSTAKLKLF